MHIREIIEDEFHPKDEDTDEELDANAFIKDSVNKLLDPSVIDVNYDAFVTRTNFKNQPFPSDESFTRKYEGKSVSRKAMEESLENLSEDIESEGDENLYGSEAESEFGENDSDTGESDSEMEEDGSNTHNSDESEIEEDYTGSDVEEPYNSNEEHDSQVESDIEENMSDKEDHSGFLYRNSGERSANNVEKGEAVKMQLGKDGRIPANAWHLGLWENLLECRIKMQKGLVAANQLPRLENLDTILKECSNDERENFNGARDKMGELLDKMLEFQEMLRRNSEFEPEAPNKKRKSGEGEFPHDGKRVKYSEILSHRFTSYEAYRNETIGKWNEKTKISSGKSAKSNFTAFDQPIVQQIQQILADRDRLLRRTRIKRSDYSVLGESKREDVAEPEFDEETFDDDDFYHKLLRDYIERKSVDATDPAQLGRKWMQLQKLRGKMKRKIDARGTKGRKLKYDPHPKLVNFMAPLGNYSWTDAATKELFSSIFGKAA